VQCQCNYREASVGVYSAQIQNQSISGENLFLFSEKSDRRVLVSGVIEKENNGGCL
jgi:hypothetical protein